MRYDEHDLVNMLTSVGGGRALLILARCENWRVWAVFVGGAGGRYLIVPGLLAH